MELLLYALGALAIAAGLAGLFLPALPGSPLLFVGALLVAWGGGFTRLGWPTLVATAVIALLMLAADHVATLAGARAAGASGRAVAGAAIGLVVGLFFGLPGLVLGPLAGAVVGEWLHARDARRAARAGVGVAAGFLVGSVAKVALAFVFLGVLAAGLLF